MKQKPYLRKIFVLPRLFVKTRDILEMNGFTQEPWLRVHTKIKFVSLLYIEQKLSTKLVRCNSLSCPPPGILSPGTLYPGVKCPTLVYLVPPLKFISYLFFFYNFCSATYFIALKMIFVCKIYYEWTK